MNRMAAWQQRDLARVWHPCSQMKEYETVPPLVMDRGEGPWLIDVEGRRYFDGIASWWVNLFGHDHPRLRRALEEQLHRLPHCMFAGCTHEAAIELAEALVARTPEGLERVFFADCGSAAVEVALKMSFQYHRQAGAGHRHTFVAFSDGYHGETLGSLAVGGLDLYGQIFAPLLFPTVKVPSPSCFRCPWGRSRNGCDAAPCFEPMGETLTLRGSEICGVIVEPLLQGAAGMKMYPPAYLQRLRKACTQAGVHLIADEIATGFGRTGTLFACDQAAIVPDLLCLSKGITGGYLPLAAVVTTESIYQGFYADPEEHRAFLHSHSYTGNALACALARETLQIFDQEPVLASNREKGAALGALAAALGATIPAVGEVRTLGMVTAVELRPPQPFGWRRALIQKARERGVLLRPMGSVLYFMPPYAAQKDDLAFLVRESFAALEEVLDSHAPRHGNPDPSPC